MKSRFFLATLILVVFLVPAPPAAAQWDSISYSGSTIHTGGFLVLHDDGTDIQAFSAVARSWLAIAPSGSTIVNGTVGDWTALIQLTDGSYVAYSARLHDTSTMTPVDPSPTVYIEDDVILITQYDQSSGDYIASGYSAQTNQWVDQVVTTIPTLILTSRFVAGFVTQEVGSPRVYGFGARIGTWADHAFGPCRGQVDGNVLCYESEQSDPVEIQAIAFSGVLNTWELADPAWILNDLHVEHNVALYFRDQNMPQFYSAYHGKWIASPHPTDATSIIRLDDNWILIERDTTWGFPKFEGFGSRPGSALAEVLSSDYTFENSTKDVALVKNDIISRAAALTGLQTSWVMKTYTSPLTFLGTPDHSVVISDGADAYHAYSPAYNNWVSQTISGATAHVDDAVAIIEASPVWFAYSARWNRWNACPPMGAGTFSPYQGGSVGGNQQIAGGSVGKVTYFDGRRNRWFDSFDPGTVCTFHTDRNTVLADTGSELFGFSAQRGDWVEASSFTSPGVTTLMDENVACAVDSAGMLFAFGTPAATHLWYGWPTDTEYQITRLDPASPAMARFSVLGSNPGWNSVLLISKRKPFFPGHSVPGVGLLYIRPPFVFKPAGSTPIGSDGLSEGSWKPPVLAGIPVVQLWSQGGARLGPDAELVGTVPEPFWNF